jgi:hypothetical protein
MRMGFGLGSSDGKRPLPLRILIAVWLLSFLIALGLLVWRDIYAPRTPSPGFPNESRGKGSAVYYVPAWFNRAITGFVCVATGLLLVIPIAQGYYSVRRIRDGETKA